MGRCEALGGRGGVEVNAVALPSKIANSRYARFGELWYNTRHSAAPARIFAKMRGFRRAQDLFY